MKILVTADIHIGKRPSQIPEDLAADYSCANIWNQIVTSAIEEKVDAVILAGDVVDEANRFYEAVGPLESGVNKLGDQGIPVYAVSGNHDYEVLPRLVETVGADKFHLLGQDGKWERVVLLKNDQPVLQIFGWSFPDRFVQSSPLPLFPKSSIDNSIPAIGIIHADIDNPGSHYCPVSRREFGSCGVHLWILGHIHKPSEFDQDSLPIVMYPGSPQGMDPGPGETGSHGPWILEYQKGVPKFKHINCAPVVYVNLTIDVSKITDIAMLQKEITDHITVSAQENARQNPDLRVISYRLEVTGRTSLEYTEIENQLELLQRTGMLRGGIDILLNKYVIKVRPRIDLEELSRGKNHLAELSRLLLNLEGPEPITNGHTELLEALQQQLSGARNSGPFLQLQSTNPQSESNEGAPRQLIIEQGWRLLEELTRQKEVHGKRS